MKPLCSLLYWVFLVLGIHAAYNNKMAVALFFAITCAGESIGASIDYWPKLKTKNEKHNFPKNSKFSLDAK